jgi:hypothetical protein
MEAAPNQLAACARILPRLAGKSWWLTRQTQVFAPDEMRDLEFEPVIPILTELARAPGGFCANTLSIEEFGARAIPVVLEGMKSPEVEDRCQACFIANFLLDPSALPDPVVGRAAADLLSDQSARVRAAACRAIANNWDIAVAPRVMEKLSDASCDVQEAALWTLSRHPDESQLPVYRKLVEDDSVAAGYALTLSARTYSREELVHFFSSTNLSLVKAAFNQFHRTGLSLEEVAPLVTNSLPPVRQAGLNELARIGGRQAMDQIVSMLRDPNEGVRFLARLKIRQITGQKLGPDPAAYEKWWKENRETFDPQPWGNWASSSF